MRKHRFENFGLVAALAALIVIPSAEAANIAAASGMLADIGAIVVQAKQNLAIAAGTGNVDAIAEASTRADATDKAMAEAMDAFAALERADIGGDDDAAESAMEDVASALRNATEALSGAIPEPTTTSERAAWKESQTNTGGGPGGAYDPPNIYNVPWHSQNLQAFYQSAFSQVWSSSSFGSGRGVGDRFLDSDATPQ
jgi:hypothetical protein